MAEAADRPADKAVIASIPEAPPAKDDAPPAPGAPQVYSSVSIVAVLGFVLAVVYTVTVGVGALIALFNRTPWILPLWMFVVPVGAAAVCWAARARIRASEGALTGARLTSWGVGLSAVVGLLYAAYYAGSYLAVTAQATTFVNGWFDLVKSDRIDQAFLNTLPPPRPRSDDPALRDRLEMEFDRAPMGQSGQYTSFRESPLVRQVEDGGADVQITFLGVQGWGYDKSSYTVDLSYRVVAGGVTADMGVAAVGVDGENGERQWYAQNPRLTSQPVVSAEAARLRELCRQASEFGQAWLDRLTAGDRDGAYLDTLPPDERARQTAERGTAFQDGRKDFLAGAVVRYDPNDFWVGPMPSDKARQEEQVKKADLVRALFGKGRADLPPLMLQKTSSPPAYRTKGDLIRVALALVIPQGDLQFQARLWLTAEVGPDEPVDDQSKGKWRVESLELVDAKTISGPMAGPPPPPKR